MGRGRGSHGQLRLSKDEAKPSLVTARGDVCGIPERWLPLMRESMARRARELREARRHSREDAVSYLLATRDEDPFGSATERRATVHLLLSDPWSAITVLGVAPSPLSGRNAYLLRATAYARCGALALAARDLRNAGLVESFDAAGADLAAEALCGPQAPPELLLGSAESWHQARRRAIVAHHPEVRDLQGASVVTPAVLGALLLLHLLTAVWLTSWWSWLPLAATVGSVCAYSFQALTHELWHEYRIGRLSDCLVIGASAVSNFPWRWYYSVHHPRHHADTGGNGDFDGIVLFRNWHSPPQAFSSSPLRRWLWSGVYAHFIFFFVAYTKHKLGAPLLFDFTRHGLPARLESEGTHLLAYAVVWHLGGWPAAAYLWWSAAFSLGCFGHPYMGFWLLQHQCPARRTGALFQPSVSYYGSLLWRLLNFEELLHVEHHDFPRIPWTRLRKVTRIAPEFYAGLVSSRSVNAAVADWVRMDNIRWMRSMGDFAGQSEYWRNQEEFPQFAYDLLGDRCRELGVEIPWVDTDSAASDETSRPVNLQDAPGDDGPAEPRPDSPSPPLESEPFR